MLERSTASLLTLFRDNIDFSNPKPSHPCATDCGGPALRTRPTRSQSTNDRNSLLSFMDERSGTIFRNPVYRSGNGVGKNHSEAVMAKQQTVKEDAQADGAVKEEAEEETLAPPEAPEFSKLAPVLASTEDQMKSVLLAAQQATQKIEAEA